MSPRGCRGGQSTLLDSSRAAARSATVAERSIVCRAKNLASRVCHAPFLKNLFHHHPHPRLPPSINNHHPLPLPFLSRAAILSSFVLDKSSAPASSAEPRASCFPSLPPRRRKGVTYTRRRHVRQEARYVPLPSQCRLFRIVSNTDVDGRQERVQFDKITARVSRLCYGLDTEHVDPVAITQKVISGVYGGVTTIQLDDLVSTRPHPSLPSDSDKPRLPRPPHT